MELFNHKDQKWKIPVFLAGYRTLPLLRLSIKVKRFANNFSN